MEIVYNLFALIDKLVYMLVSQMFSLIDNLANYNFFSDNTISEFTSKVYTILAVLMLFMLVISAIQYLVNPDSLSDNKKGLSTILTRSLIAVVLIAVVPTIFKFALSVQSTLVEEIPKIVLGGENNESLGATADKVSLNILLGFVSEKEDMTQWIRVHKSDVQSLSDFPSLATDGCGNHNWYDIAAVINGGHCNYNYIIILPTIVGGFLVFILASMAIDIGIRTIKLGVVQLLAPIPIVSSITDEKKLQTWAKTSGQVYADLFIRMFVVYFVIYFIRVVLYDLFFGNTIGDLKNTGFMDIIWVKVFIIIALLLFAKNAPKFITDLLGMQGADESIGNMFKRAGGMFGTMTSLPGRFTAGRRNALNEAYKKAGIDFNSDEWKNKSAEEKRRALKEAAKKYGKGANAKAFRSAGAALRHGMYESVAHNKGYKEARSEARSAADRSYAISKKLDEKGVTRSAYYREAWNNKRGIESSFATSSLEIEGAKAISDSSKAALDYVHNNIGAKFSKVQFDEAGFQMAASKINGKIFVGYDKAGNSINLDVGDMSNTFERDSHGNLKLDANNKPIMKKGSYTLAGVIKGLQEIISDTTGRFTAQQKATAEGDLDLIQGIADSFIVSNAQNKSVVGDENPAFLNIIQDAKDNIGKYSGNTQFGKSMIELGKTKGILDKDGNVINGKLGEWISLNKKEGQRSQTSAKAGMDLTSLAAKEIADQFKKGS